MGEIHCVLIFYYRGSSGKWRWSSLEPPKFKEVRLYNTLTWPQKAGNPISEDLNNNIFWERMSPEPPPGDHPRRLVSGISPLILTPESALALTRHVSIQCGLSVMTRGNFLTLSLFAVLDFFVWSCCQNQK